MTTTERHTDSFRVAFVAPGCPETQRRTVAAKDAQAAQEQVEARIPDAKVFHVQEV